MTEMAEQYLREAARVMADARLLLDIGMVGREATLYERSVRQILLDEQRAIQSFLDGGSPTRIPVDAETAP